MLILLILRSIFLIKDKSIFRSLQYVLATITMNWFTCRLDVKINQEKKNSFVLDTIQIVPVFLSVEEERKNCCDNLSLLTLFEESMSASSIFVLINFILNLLGNISYWKPKRYFSESTIPPVQTPPLSIQKQMKSCK